MRTWSKPELIVVARNRPEEHVLGGCKDGIQGSGAVKTASDCFFVDSYCFECTQAVLS